jgi:hypothetical protein
MIGDPCSGTDKEKLEAASCRRHREASSCKLVPPGNLKILIIKL